MAVSVRRVTKVTSITGFIDAVKAIPIPRMGLRTFRGQLDASWINHPGILRPDYKNLLKFERDIVREIQSVHPQEFQSDTTMFDRLVRMQHYGLPTRLLDVTANPLVALYFATEERTDLGAPDGKVTCFIVPKRRAKYYDSDTVSCLANLANMSDDEKAEILAAVGDDDDSFNELPVVDRLLQFIRSEKGHFRNIIVSKELDTRWFVWPKLSNRRIVAQSGAFIIHGLRLSRKYPRGLQPITTREIKIDTHSKHKIRAELHDLGINQSTLFPELDKAADDIKRRYAT